MADRSSLARATEGTEAPTPGYLYVDIAKNVASSPTACQDAAQYLARRLSSKQNPQIKYKCLRVMAKTALSVKPFQRACSQDANIMSTVKEALQFRAPPDPLRGDEPAQKVRTAAKEALDAIYSDAAGTSSNVAMTTSMSGIGGGGSMAMASSSYNSTPSGPRLPGSHPHSTGRRMEGIGNPRYKDPRAGSDKTLGEMTVGDIFKEAGTTIAGMIRDPLANNVDLGPPGGSSRRYGEMQPPPGRDQIMSQTGGQWTMATNRGANAYGTDAPGGGGPPGQSSYYNRPNPAFEWAQGQSSGASSSSGGVGGSWGAPSGPSSQPSVASQAREPPYSSSSNRFASSSQTSLGNGGTAVSDGTYEKNLILELCPPGGLKPEPPADKLRRFAQAVPNLNPDLVCPALLDCLEDGNPWIMRAKALCVMETCISVSEKRLEQQAALNPSETPGTNKYAEFFYTCRGEIEPLVNHPRSAIQQPAKRVLILLGVEATSSTAAVPAKAPAAAPPAPPAADLLDFGNDPSTLAQPPQPTATAAKTPSTSGGGSLFGGLNVQGGGTAPAPTVAKIKDTPAPAPSAGLFDSMNVKSNAPAATAPAPAPSSGFDFMSSEAKTDAVPAPASPEKAASSGFDFLQQPATEPAKAAITNNAAAPTSTASTAEALQELGQAAATGGSAFGFIASDTKAPVPKAPPPSKGSFDPLNSAYKPSPNTIKAMTMDPIQLQAMYAQQQQQNLLMMQMQQMQIAMAMQQKQQGQKVVGAPHLSMPSPQAATRKGSNPNVMVTGGLNATSSFSFLDVGAKPPAAKEDPKFDFIKDAMKNEKTK